MADLLELTYEAAADALDSNVELFLDTSAQIDRLFGSRGRRAAMHALTKGRIVYTSSTVFREFQGSILSAYQFVADTLRDVKQDSRARLSEIAALVAEQPGLFGERRAKRVLLVVGQLQSAFAEQADVNPRDLADFCDDEIRRYRSRRFFIIFGEPGVDIRVQETYIDEVSCAVAERPVDPTKPAAVQMSCDKATRRCNVRSLLLDGRAALQNLDDEWKKRRPRSAVVASSVLSWADEDFQGNQAIGQNFCWPLGDVVIALECPPQAVIVTSDRDFADIGPEVAKSVLRLRAAR